jgi:hypothetical protein
MLKLRDNHNWLFVAVVVIAAVALVGVIVILLTHAATVFISTEPETGTPSGTAKVVPDTTASKGGAITFSAPPPVACTGNPTSPNSFTLTGTVKPSVTMAWTASLPASGCTLAGYRFWRSTGTTAPDVTAAPYASLAGLTYENTVVKLGTVYTYTIVSYDTAGHQSAGVTKTVTVPASDWTWPVNAADLTNQAAGLTQCWLHYYSPKASYHAAMDIGVNYKPVYAPHAGKVVGKYSDGYNTLVINTGVNAATGKTLYAVFEHMSAITINNGATVTKGQRIGTSGEVGAPGAPHLHFGISDSATAFGTYANPWHTANPLDFLPADYSDALEKTSALSCKTSNIKTNSDYGFAKYKISGTFSMYK